jgi:hypothetical protein
MIDKIKKNLSKQMIDKIKKKNLSKQMIDKIKKR